MDIIIASNEQSIASQLRNCLAKVGVDCTRLPMLSHESVPAAIAAHQGPAPVLLFLASPHVTANELTLLSQLCTSGCEFLKVVVVSFSLSAGAILQAVRSGAVDFLSINSNLENEIRYLLDRIQSTAGQKNRVGRLWTVIAAAGGSGASMLATNLAAVIAQREQRCGLLDLHWRGGDVATLLNSRPRHTLLSLSAKAEQLDRTMLEHSLVRHDCGVHFLASPEPFSDYRQIHSELIQKIVQLSRTTFSTVVADLEDCEHFDQVRTLAASDRIVIPLRPDFVSLIRTKKLLSHLMSAGVRRNHIRIVANRIGQPKELAIPQIEKALETQVCIQIPDDPVAANEAVNLGMPLVMACRHSKVAAGIVHLADSLLDIAKPPRRWHTAKELLEPVRNVGRILGVSL